MQAPTQGIHARQGREEGNAKQRVGRLENLDAKFARCNPLSRSAAPNPRRQRLLFLAQATAQGMRAETEKTSLAPA